MKRIALAAFLLGLATPVLARQPDTYQVTGVVDEVADDLIVVKKGKETFEIARTPDTKVTGELKKGAKATVHYRMTATSADVAPEKAGKAKK